MSIKLELSTYFTQLFGSLQHRHLSASVAHRNGCRQPSNPRTDDTDMYLTRTLSVVSVNAPARGTQEGCLPWLSPIVERSDSKAQDMN